MDLHGNELFVTGAFQVDIDFDGSLELTGQQTIRDVFVAKFEEATSGITERSGPALSICPVPANEFLYVSGVTGLAPFAIVDALGRRTRTGQLSNAPIDIAELPPGTYQLVVGGSARATARFVKQ
jgi:hypothetical protein